jgi:hypothetical protein
MSRRSIRREHGRSGIRALRYPLCHRDARRSDHFIGGDPHDGPMPMDYFMWLARGGGRSFVIDTGFNAQVANKRRRTTLVRLAKRTLSASSTEVSSDSRQGTTTPTRTGVANIMSTARTFAIRIDDSAFGLPR